ncbi:hypothetical protein MaudCBS49596_007230 [Microsporum audouinii]
MSDLCAGRAYDVDEADAQKRLDQALLRAASHSANNGHYDGATVLAGRLIKPGSNTEARAVVPDDTYRHMLEGYYLRLALQEEHPPAHRQIPLHYAPSNGLIVVVKTLLISLATI